MTNHEPIPSASKSTSATPALELMADQDGERLDQFLARRLDGASRTQSRRLIDDGLVRIEGALERPSYKLRFGELVSILPRETVSTESATEITLDVVTEDEHLAVINKQAGLTVHPAPGETQPTLIAALVERWPEIVDIASDDPTADPQRPGLVHRLDRDTTGLLLIAKTAVALAALRDQFRARTVDKRYLAITLGAPDPPAGMIDAPIGRDPADPRRMTILDRARPSQTGYETVERYSDATLLDCHLITGRTHQIRVHLSAIGHPIAGDPLYGVTTPLIGRQALHARTLTIQHPISGNALTVEADPPADIQHLLAELRSGHFLLGDQHDQQSSSDQRRTDRPADSVNRRPRTPRRGRRRRTQRIR